jgi:zinc transport system substrate-binding protein
MFVYNGAGFEPWAEKLIPSLPAAVVKVNATAGLPLVAAESEVERDRRPAATGNAGLDPHVWLDPVLAQQQVDNILAGFVSADPTHRAVYEARAATLKSELRALDYRYRTTLATCRLRVFITNHAAFGYLAGRYGLTMLAISGLSPEAEPSPARLKEIVRLARRHDIRIIYFETLVSPRVAETIAREVGAQTQVLNPIEGLSPDEQRRGVDYFKVMDENLRHLADGLDCR